METSVFESHLFFVFRLTFALSPTDNTPNLFSEQIFLTDNTIYGPIPPEMSSLTQLRRLQLPRNQLSGRIPSGIASLVQLEVLSLGRNIISNSIPSEIGMMTNLKYLNVNRNDLQGRVPSHLGMLSNLEFLSLEGNMLTGSIPTEMSNLQSLTTLALHDNALDGPVPAGVCNTAASQDNFQISVDCDTVQCSCCTPACNDVPDGPQTTPATVGAAPATAATPAPQLTIAPPTSPPTTPSTSTSTIPFVDSATVQQQLQQANNSYAIYVGSDCYTPDFSIDFTTESSQPTPFDVLTLVPLPPSDFFGNGPTLSLGDAVSGSATATAAPGTSEAVTSPVADPTYNFTAHSLLWAGACGMAQCEGVVADGFMYYSTGVPSISSPQAASWPLDVGWYQLQLVLVDESSTAYVTARSLPFSVSETC